MYNAKYAFSVLSMLGVLLLVSCNDNPTVFNEDPPTLPPELSMTMDMSGLENQGTQSKSGEYNSVQSADAFVNAAVRAAVIKVVVDVNLYVPRLLLQTASTVDPQFNENGEWVWAYSRTAGEQTYEVRLVATQAENDQTKWDFFVSNSEAGISDRLFFSGLSANDGSSGVWTYYSLDPNTTGDEALSRVEWNVNGGEDVYLKLEVLTNNSDYFGDYIEYTFDGTVRNVVYYDTSEDATLEIQYNVVTRAGFLVAPDFNNGVKACWDGTLQDVTCEEV